MNEDELIYKLNNTTIGSQELHEYNAYIVKVDDMIGVAIPIKKNIIIKERFNKVYISNFIFKINNIDTKVIFLYTKEAKMSEKYASICLNFISKNSREVLETNPIEWYNDWRELLGDSKSQKMIYDYIGEMVVLLELQKKGKFPIWNSITKGTFDITTDDCVYEVKTTKIKSFDSITIHNQFQLDTKGFNKKLYIAYIKVEENNAGESIDSLANQLIKNGFDKLILEKYLTDNGFYEGKNDRYKKYIILEKRLYLVDENFPSITNDSFIDKKIPKNVIKYEYTLSLDGLEFTTF